MGWILPLGTATWPSSPSAQVWRHFAGGQREKHLGDDPHGPGALSKGAPGENHPDHRLLARQPAVAALRARLGTALTNECQRGQSFRWAGLSLARCMTENFDSCRSSANSFGQGQTRRRGHPWFDWAVLARWTGEDVGPRCFEVLRAATRRPSFYWNFTQCVRCVLEEENQHVANASSSTIC